MKFLNVVAYAAAAATVAVIASLPSAAQAAYPYQAPKNIPPPEGCTSILVDPHASIDGGMTTHTNDCHQCDSRISAVPARDWPPGSLRPVYRYRATYPRFLGSDRGSTYEVANTDTSFYPWQPTQAHGYVPQVSHTYAYIDGHYAIENEHQVAIGESTCAARQVALPLFDGGAAMFDIQQLSRVGLERGRTARQVVEIMGRMAEQYGYYGAEWRGPMAEGEAGEVLMVTDPTESYTFHILPDSTGKSAVWAAQKLQKGHVAVCANAFFIKEIDFSDHETFLYSTNILTDAKKMGFWDESYGPFHFTKTYGLVTTFEAYSSHRTWRIFNLVAPSLNLPLEGTSVDVLPFSVKAERLLSKHDIMKIQRDHYEGTEIDQTVGLEGGPYGNPNRYDRSDYWNTSRAVLFQGNFERVISLHRTIYSFVTTSRPYVPNYMALLWFASGIPHASYYTPVYVLPTSPPYSLTVGSLHGFDRRSSFWATTTIAGWMEKCFKLTTVVVTDAQLALEHELDTEVQMLESLLKDEVGEEEWMNGAAIAAQTASATIHAKSSKKLGVDPTASALSSPASSIVAALASFNLQTGARSLSAWWSLFEHVVTQFHDGFRVDDVHVDQIAPRPVFYPTWWLEAVGFWGGKKPDYSKTSVDFLIHPPTLHPALNQAPQVTVPTETPAQAAARVSAVSAVDVPAAASAADSASVSTGTSSFSSVMSTVFLVAVCVLLGMIGGYKLAMREAEKAAGGAGRYFPIQQIDA